MNHSATRGQVSIYLAGRPNGLVGLLYRLQSILRLQVGGHTPSVTVKLCTTEGPTPVFKRVGGREGPLII